MILKAYAILCAVYLAEGWFMELHMPKSYFIMGYIISFCLTTGMRFSYRMLRFYINRTKHISSAEDRIMIIGAGDAGRILLREMRSSQKLHCKVCCVIDDNPNKRGRMIEGVEIVGDRHDIVRMARKYSINRIIYAIPSSNGDERKDILNICKETGCKLQTIPEYISW